MQIQGDIKKFTNTIEKTFEKQLSEVKATYEAELDSVKSQEKHKQSEIKAAYAQKLKKETELFSKKETSHAICEARSRFDEEKKELFEQIFNDIASDAKSVASKEYKAAVKSAVDELSAADVKNATLIVSAKTLVPSSYKGRVDVTNDFLGAKILLGESVTDLSLETVLETKKGSIEVLLHDTLFE